MEIDGQNQPAADSAEKLDSVYDTLVRRSATRSCPAMSANPRFVPATVHLGRAATGLVFTRRLLWQTAEDRRLRPA